MPDLADAPPRYASVDGRYPTVDRWYLSRGIFNYMRLAHLPTLKKHRGMHSLRHTAASRMLESGVPLETISQILGHEDPDSTDVYLKTDVERLRECCEELEEVCR